MKKIIQTDEDIGKMLAAVPVVVAKMTELFLTNLLERGGELAEERGAATLTQHHLASVIREDHRWKKVNSPDQYPFYVCQDGLSHSFG